MTEGLPRSRLHALSRVSRLVFYVWTAVGFFVVPLDLTDERLRAAVTSPPIAALATRILAGSDAAWQWFAALVTWTALADAVSIRRALACAVGIGGVAAVVEWVGVTTGIPFGPYLYSDRLGPRLLGVLPLTIPAAWFTVVVNGHHLFPNRPWRPLAVGLVAVLTDLSLELVAWRIRGYWTWYPGVAVAPAAPPLQNYASWFLLGAALDWAFLRRVEAPALRRTAAGVLTAINVLFWVTIACWRLRGGG